MNFLRFVVSLFLPFATGVRWTINNFLILLKVVIVIITYLLFVLGVPLLLGSVIQVLSGSEVFAIIVFSLGVFILFFYSFFTLLNNSSGVATKLEKFVGGDSEE